MAPEGPNDDFEFIMTCLKYTDSKTKPNFNLVAKEIGAKSANAAYVFHFFLPALHTWCQCLLELYIAITDTGA